MASSLIFLAMSVVMFIIVFGILFQITPAILGAFYTVTGNVIVDMEINSEWVAIYNEIDALSQYLVPLVMALGIVLLVIKVLMVASARGNE